MKGYPSPSTAEVRGCKRAKRRAEKGPRERNDQESPPIFTLYLIPSVRNVAAAKSATISNAINASLVAEFVFRILWKVEDSGEVLVAIESVLDEDHVTVKYGTSHKVVKASVRGLWRLKNVSSRGGASRCEVEFYQVRGRIYVRRTSYL